MSGTPIESLPQESQVMIQSLYGESDILKLANVWKGLQGAVDNLLDVNMNTKRPTPGRWQSFS